ncbi:MAG: hypothetical protein ACKO1W_04245 [Microcystaceae cyanobacterium]
MTQKGDVMMTFLMKQQPDSKTNLREEKIKEIINSFLESFKDAVEDLSALEVNTMIASEINGLKFNPENAYRALYDLLKDVDSTPDKAYNSVKDEFAQNTLAKLKRNVIGAVQDALREPGQNRDLTQTNLPEPGTEKANKLLKNKHFIVTLRKLNELRSLINKPDFDEDNIYDNIYAQTIIQIDGDVMNYFHRRLFADEHIDQRNLLLQIHGNAVESGQKNWQGILRLIVDMLSQIPKVFDMKK